MTGAPPGQQQGVLGDRWGVSEAEVRRAYPCDELVPSPAVALWRGVTVQAPPDRVWPWVRQLRVAPYSYDWIDNAGRRSPRTLLDLPDPRPGQPFSTVAGGRDAGRVVSVEPGHQLTASILGALMSYVLLAEGEGTRLLLKVVVPQRRWYGPALAMGNRLMARRQLLNLKQLAERSTLGVTAWTSSTLLERRCSKSECWVPGGHLRRGT